MRFYHSTLVAVFISLVLCTRQQSPLSNSGGGTEISGRVLTPDLKPAPLCTVIVITPSATRTAYSDSAGFYAFYDRIPYGDYTLQGVKDSLAFIARGLYHGEHDSARVDTLRKTGWVRAVVRLEDKTNRRGIEMYIPGTSYIAKSDSAGAVALFNVPAGAHDIVFEYSGYEQYSTQTFVKPGVGTILDSVILYRKGIPKKIQVTFDSLTGVARITWNKLSDDVLCYCMKVDTIQNHAIGAATYRLIPDILDTFFYDTIFRPYSFDTLALKYRNYQVAAVDSNDNIGDFGRKFGILVNRPTVPPAPYSLLAYTQESMIISVTSSLPQLWWGDSIFISRSIDNGAEVHIASLSVRNVITNKDSIKDIPKVTDSLIKVTYVLWAKSRYDRLSSLSHDSITIVNPYLLYTVPAPAGPTGPQSVTPGRYVFAFSSVISPIAGDSPEYRLIISDSTRTSDSTAWYSIPCIETPLETPGTHFILCQARTRSFHLYSRFSDTLAVVVLPIGSALRPSTP